MMDSRLAALAVSFALLSGCAAEPPVPITAAAVPTPTPMPVDPNDPPETRDRDLRFTPIDTLTFSEDRLVIHLTFVGAKDFAPNDPCSVEYAAVTEVGDDVLEVGVFEARRGTPPRLGQVVACEDLGYPRFLDVVLSEPFTGTAWRDLTGYTHFLTGPENLVQLDVPEGWQLIGGRDVEGSPQGRWERTYAPTRDAPPEQRLVVYQSLGGPVNVTGGDERSVVEVNGEPAVLYRHAPSGELVLVFSVGDVELALVGYEETFTADDLVDIAESAALPEQPD